MEDRIWVRDNERLEHVTIGVGNWRNFRGERTENNKNGRRVFNVFLPEELARDLKEIGWNVKEHEPYQENGDSSYTLEIEASYDTKNGQFPPPLVRMTAYDGTEVLLSEETIGQLDQADIADATVEFRPYNWDVNGKWGCKAYLQELNVLLKMPRRARNASLRRQDEDDEY